jgi:hypothetical protein
MRKHAQKPTRRRDQEQRFRMQGEKQSGPRDTRRTASEMSSALRTSTKANLQGCLARPIGGFAPSPIDRVDSSGRQPALDWARDIPAREGPCTFVAAPALVHGVLVVCATASLGCGPAPDGRQKAQTWPSPSELSAVYTPEQAAALDFGLTASIKLKLLLDREVSGRQINVDTCDRVVVLKGRIDSEAERARAIRIARETHGVASVADRLTRETSSDM